jgi:hypothetical protein
VQNAFIECFNGWLRDELSNETQSTSLAHARAAPEELTARVYCSWIKVVGKVTESMANIIFKMNDLLPRGGEWSVSYRSSKADLIITIKYEDDTDDTACSFFIKDLVFSHAQYVFNGSFPGNDVLMMPGMAVEFGAVVEFKDSKFLADAGRIWRSVSGREYYPPFRHFYVTFLSENRFFHVIALDANLSDERRAD